MSFADKGQKYGEKLDLISDKFHKNITCKILGHKPEPEVTCSCVRCWECLEGDCVGIC